MDKFIDICNLCYSYKKENIISNLSMSLNKHEFVSILGNNGSGKTTLSKLICGMLVPKSGKISLDKEDISNMQISEIGKKVGYLFQNPDKQIFGETVRDELSFAMRFNGIDEVIIKKKIDKVINRFELGHLLNRRCYLLSYGEKQRLALATLFLNNPEYVILDEPTTGLDPNRKDILFQILKELHTSGIGILMISHDLDFVERLSERTIVIEDGKVKKDEYCTR